MKKEKEILEGINKIKDVIVNSEEKKKEVSQIGWMVSSLFISLTIAFFALTMKRLNANSKYALFAENTVKVVIIFSFLLFIISTIILVIFLKKRQTQNQKIFK